MLHDLKDRVSSVLYIPIYSYIWKTVLYIPIFQGKQEMLNSYLKQMLKVSNMARYKLVIIVNSMAPEELKSADLGISNLLSDEDIMMRAARQELSGLKHESHKRKEILRVRSFYSAVAKYMIRRLPFDSVLLKTVTYPSPVRRFNESSVSDMEVLAREIHCDEKTVLHLVDEWKVYQTEDHLSNEYERINHY